MDRIQHQRSPAHQSAAAEDTIYISMCSGGAIIKIGAAERPKYILGELIVLGVAFVVSLIKLAIWLTN
jgi:hypothetical protein